MDGTVEPHFFQLLDRIRYEAAVSAVSRDGRSLALISTSQALAEYYKQALLERLEAELPRASIKPFFPADTDAIVQAFNKVVARMPLDQARTAPAPKQPVEVWVVHDAAALAASEVQTMLNLIEKFPGANVHALLVFGGVRVAPEGLDAFEKSLMRWEVDRPTLEQIKDSISKISDPTRAAEVRDLVARIVGNGSSPTAAAGEATAANPAGARSATADTSGAPEPAGSRRPARFKPAGVSAVLLALSVGIAAWLNPLVMESWLPSFHQKAVVDAPAETEAASEATSEPSKDAAPADAVKEDPVELAVAKLEGARAPATDPSPPEAAQEEKPPTEAALIAQAQRWAGQLKRNSYVVQHAYHTSYLLAIEHHRRYPNLPDARVVPQYEQDTKRPRFALISGPFESRVAAEAFMKSQSMPKESWVRMSRGIQERLEPTLD